MSYICEYIVRYTTSQHDLGFCPAKSSFGWLDFESRDRLQLKLRCRPGGYVNGLRFVEEYVRGDAHTNTAEGYFGLFKRGMKGIYQHCSEKHLHRYLAEFDFRYNNRVALGVGDQGRTATALRGIVGKRLKYKDSSLASI